MEETQEFIATGPETGLVVLEVDGRGQDLVRLLARPMHDRYVLPTTLTFWGRESAFLVFAHRGPVPSKLNDPFSLVKVHAAGDKVAAPPTDGFLWADGLGPDKISPAPIPPCLAGLFGLGPDLKVA